MTSKHPRTRLQGPTSYGLISQLLRYGVLTLSGLLHRPFEFQASSLDLPNLAVQALNLAPGGHQSIFQLFFAVTEICTCNSQLAANDLLFKKGQRLKLTSSLSVKLRSGLHGPAPFLSKLVFEPLLISDHRLTNLPELSLKVGNT
jgi:hypothetical protein